MRPWVSAGIFLATVVALALILFRGSTDIERDGGLDAKRRESGVLAGDGLGEQILVNRADSHASRFVRVSLRSPVDEVKRATARVTLGGRLASADDVLLAHHSRDAESTEVRWGDDERTFSFQFTPGAHAIAVVAVAAPNCLPVERVVSLGVESRDVSILLSPGAELEVQLVDSSHEPIQGGLVIVQLDEAAASGAVDEGAGGSHRYSCDDFGTARVMVKPGESVTLLAVPPEGHVGRVVTAYPEDGLVVIELQSSIGVLVGTVVGSDRRPIARAQVSAMSPSWFSEDDLSVASTDDEGRFSLDVADFGDGTVRLVVIAEGFEITRLVSGIDDAQNVVIQLDPSSAREFAIALPDGSPVGGVEVEVLFPDLPTLPMNAISDEAGRVTLPGFCPGDTDAFVSIWSGRSRLWGPCSVKLDSAQGPIVISGIGRLILPQGSDSWYWASASLVEEPQSVVAWSPSAASPWLKSGSHDVVLYSNSGACLRTSIEVPLDSVLTWAPSMAGSATVQFVLADGSEVIGKRVGVETVGRQVLAESIGVAGVNVLDCPAGDVYLFWGDAGAAVGPFNLQPGLNRLGAIEPERTCSLFGVLTSSLEVPARLLSVSVLREDGWASVGVVIRSDGSFSANNLPPGQYEVQASVSDDYCDWTVTRTVQLTAGVRMGPIALDAEGRARTRVRLLGHVGAPVTLRSWADGAASEIRIAALESLVPVEWTLAPTLEARWSAGSSIGIANGRSAAHGEIDFPFGWSPTRISVVDQLGHAVPFAQVGFRTDPSGLATWCTADGDGRVDVYSDAVSRLDAVAVSPRGDSATLGWAPISDSRLLSVHAGDGMLRLVGLGGEALLGVEVQCFRPRWKGKSGPGGILVVPSAVAGRDLVASDQEFWPGQIGARRGELVLRRAAGAQVLDLQVDVDSLQLVPGFAQPKLGTIQCRPIPGRERSWESPDVPEGEYHVIGRDESGRPLVEGQISLAYSPQD